MLDSCFSFPGLKCLAIGSPSQFSSDGQLIYLPRTQVLGSCSTFIRLKYRAVDLLSQNSNVGQLI